MLLMLGAAHSRNPPGGAGGGRVRCCVPTLGLSPRTVTKHLEHVFAKLGVETRAAAAALASREWGR
jgi:hypothetical protein